MTSNNSGFTSINNLDKLSKMIEIIAKEKKKNRCFFNLRCFSQSQMISPDDRLARISKRERSKKKWRRNDQRDHLFHPLLLANLRIVLQLNSVNANRWSRSARDHQHFTRGARVEAILQPKKGNKRGGTFPTRVHRFVFDSCWRTYARVALAS